VPNRQMFTRQLVLAVSWITMPVDMNRFMGHVMLGRWEYRKEFGQEVSEEDLGLDRGRAVNFILEEYVMNVDFGFNCPW